MFDEIVGHIEVKNYLQKALLQKKLPNTLLFSGIEGIGKKKMALALAQKLLQKFPENHPDFHLLTPEGKSGTHSIESIRDAIGESHTAPFQAQVKVFMIESAERMQPASSNALLKTLEEPTLDSYWILLSSAPQEILPTILSRCAKIPFHPLATSEIFSILQKLKKPTELAPFSHGSLTKILEISNFPQMEEIQSLLFSLFSENITYPQQSIQLEKIEKLIDTEDPVQYQTRVKHLFALISMYFRDGILRETTPKSPYFFLQNQTCRTAQTNWEEILDEVRLAFERNIKLTTVLEYLLLKIRFR